MKSKIDAKRQAMRFLERMDRTEYELFTKLKEKGYEDDEINGAIDFVKSYNYVNDERFTLHYIDINKGHKSRRKINFDLKNKGIRDEMLENAWYKFEPYSETDLIKKIIDKKYDDLKSLDYAEISKVKAGLARKGFELYDINMVITEYLT